MPKFNRRQFLGSTPLPLLLQQHRPSFRLPSLKRRSTLSSWAAALQALPPRMLPLRKA